MFRTLPAWAWLRSHSDAPSQMSSRTLTAAGRYRPAAVTVPPATGSVVASVVVVAGGSVLVRRRIGHLVDRPGVMRRTDLVAVPGAVVAGAGLVGLAVGVADRDMRRTVDRPVVSGARTARVVSGVLGVGGLRVG